jgi:anti-anti-sigma factor
VPNLQVALVPAPDQVVVRVTGDADRSTAGRLDEALHRAAGLGTRRVVVDVAGARFRDASGLQVLTRFTAALAPAGRQCRVVGAPAVTRRLVQSAGLTDRLELDGPLGGADPVRPARPVRADLPAREPAPAPAPPGRRSPVARHPVAGARHADGRWVRRALHPDLPRRWR